MRDAPPTVNYIPDASYHLLMAEIALQRQEHLTAAAEYLIAAEESEDPELASRSAEFAFEYGFDVFALRSARRWVQLEPENLLGHEYLTRLYLRRNDIDRAFFHLQQALGPVADRTDEDYLSMGRNLAEEDNVAGATTLLARLTIEDPDSAGLRISLARVAYLSGAVDLALDSAQRATVLDPDSISPRLLIAQTMFASGAEDDALAYLEENISHAPNLNLELEYIRLMSLIGRDEEVSEAFRILADQYGTQPELVRQHALVTLASGDLETASRDFNQLLAAGFNVYECYYFLGQIAVEQELYHQAIRSFARISAGTYLVSAQISVSEAYNRLGDPQTGLNHLTEFAEDYPRYAFEILDAQARLLQVMGRDEDALRAYELALQIKPDTIRLLIARGAVLERLGELDQAITAMERAVAVAPMDAMALNTLGYTLANRTRRYSDAYRYIRIALELDPGSAAIIDSMGWVLYRQGRLDEARSYLELAYQLFPDAEVAAHLGEVLWVTGERDEARKLWEASLMSYPESDPLNETMARFLDG